MASASCSGVLSFAGGKPSFSASLGTTGRTSLFSRRRSALEKNRSGVSSATSSPPFRTRMRSAPVSSSRWWVTCRTVFSDCRAWRYSRTSMRPAESSMEVGSSRTSISGSATRRPARATRCFSPPERVWGSRRSKPSRPTVRIALATLSRISSRGTPRFSRPKATSSSTKGATRPFSGFWKRRPRCLRTSNGSLAGSRPDTSTRPESGFRRPFKRRTRVDLPPPFGPTTPTYSPWVGLLRGVVDQLQVDGLGAVAEPGAQLQDTSVARVTVVELGGYILEEAADYRFVLEDLDRLAPGGEVVPFGRVDEFVHDAAKLLRLRGRRLYAAVCDHLPRHRAEHEVAVLCLTAELPASFSVPHCPRSPGNNRTPGAWSGSHRRSSCRGYGCS